MKWVHQISCRADQAVAAFDNRLPPVYNFMADLPAMDGEPLPGSRDHQQMYLRGERMEAATDKYDAEHAAADQAQTRAEEMRQIESRRDAAA